MICQSCEVVLKTMGQCISCLKLSDIENDSIVSVSPTNSCDSVNTFDDNHEPVIRKVHYQKKKNQVKTKMAIGYSSRKATTRIM